MGTLTKVAETKDVGPGQAIAVDAAGQKVAIFNVEGKFYAIGDACTHRGGSLSQGGVKGTQVTCPLHRAVFDLTTGNHMSPPAPKGVPCYKVTVEGGDIKIEV